MMPKEKSTSISIPVAKVVGNKQKKVTTKEAQKLILIKRSK